MVKEQKINRRNIRLIVYDFDGVLTDDKVILREDGLESVVVNRADGLAIKTLKKSGLHQIILTAEKNKVVQARARKLGIFAIRGVEDKKRALLLYCKKNNIPLNNVMFVGNDINDLEVMKMVRYSVCPSSACKEIKDISGIILNAKGGEGVVRELFGRLIN